MKNAFEYEAELAALREELAQSNAAHNVAEENHAALNTTIFRLEQRNAELVELLRNHQWEL